MLDFYPSNYPPLKSSVISVDAHRRDDLVSEIYEWVSCNPLDKSLQASNKLEARSNDKDVSILLDHIVDSFDRHVGFSFVRMGDGEGRFTLSNQSYPLLDEFSHALARKVWFAYSDLYPGPAFYESMCESYRQANVVGYIPSYRIDIAYHNIWYGYYGCVNGNKFIIDEIGVAPASLVRNWAHSNLVNHVGFRQFVRGKHLGFVTCHNKSAELAHLFEADQISIFLTPPENHPLLLNECKQRMWPDAFNRVIAELDRCDADIIFVSCGVFGKLFCHLIKQRGKIAIDLGSVIDSMLGFRTR